MSQQATLTVEVGAHRGRVFALGNDGTFVIGRDRKCDLSIPSGTVTRIHCKIHGTRGAFSIEDLRSRHGTYVNGVKIKSRPLRPGDIVMVGGARLRFDLAEVEEAGAHAPEGAAAQPTSPAAAAPAPPAAATERPRRQETAPARPEAEPAKKAPAPREADLVPLRVVEPDTERGVFFFSDRDLSFRGETFGDLELAEPVGKGRRCLVYRAQDRKAGRIVAVKMLRPKCQDNPDVQHWFTRGTRMSSQMRHENVIQILGGGRCRGTMFMVLEFMAQNAFQRFRHAPEEGLPTVRHALQAATVVCRALEYGAMSQQRLHGGVRPSKVLFTPEGEGKLSGLGFNNRPGGPGLDKPGPLAPYLAPETLREGATRHIREDIFSFGATLHYMLTAKPPAFEGRGKLESPKQSNPAVPDSIVRILEKSAAIRPEERYENYAHLMHDLRWALRGEVWRKG